MIRYIALYSGTLMILCVFLFGIIQGIREFRITKRDRKAIDKAEDNDEVTLH